MERDATLLCRFSVTSLHTAHKFTLQCVEGLCWYCDYGLLAQVGTWMQRSSCGTRLGLVPYIYIYTSLRFWGCECSKSRCPTVGFPGFCRFAVVATLPRVRLHPTHAPSLGLCIHYSLASGWIPESTCVGVYIGKLSRLAYHITYPTPNRGKGQLYRMNACVYTSPVFQLFCLQWKP